MQHSRQLIHHHLALLPGWHASANFLNVRKRIKKEVSFLSCERLPVNVRTCSAAQCFSYYNVVHQHSTWLAINPRNYEDRRQLPWKILRLRNYGAQQVRGRKKVNKSKTYQPRFTLWRLEGAARAYGLGLGWDLWFKSYAACSSNNNTNTLTTLRDALKIETIETQCIWWCQMIQSWIFQLTFLATFLITG